MGYLTFEIGLFLIVAFLLGLFIGWWVFAQKAAAKIAHLQQEAIAAQKALEDCQSARRRMERDDTAARTKLNDSNRRITELEAALAAAKEEAQSAVAVEDETLAKPQGLMSAVTPPSEEIRAKLEAGPFLDKPVGVPDDLMLIKGVGPKLAATLDSLGVFHFFQIAGWSDADIAKVDDRLKFKGRIVRDNWVDQATLLAAGDHEAFTAKYGELGENRK